MQFHLPIFKLKTYFRNASFFSFDNFLHRLREKENEINKLKEQYETEINNLRGQVRQKQRQLELIMGENR